MESVIKNYLNDNRRIVVPEFGAFLKKEDGRLIFVPFLNKDDGVLNAEVRQFYGVDNNEAATIIKEFTESATATINNNGYFNIEGLGALRKDSNGITYLEVGQITPPPPTPVVKSEPKPVVTEQPIKPVIPPIKPTIKQESVETAPKKKTDMILVIAIIVALVAIAVMVYGYFIQDVPAFNLK